MVMRVICTSREFHTVDIISTRDGGLGKGLQDR
jgi:hypothetical protein